MMNSPGHFALYELKRAQLDRLEVRAGAEGVLQELLVEVGHQVTVGTILAKMAQPTRLKAELKIPETQAKDVQIGLLASIDTRNGIISTPWRFWTDSNPGTAWSFPICPPGMPSIEFD
jgi:multidrug efflux pump subunit AcrA (membrane-fusion protein)